MIRKLLTTSIAAATAMAALPALAQSRNGVESIEEIQVTSTMRRSTGLADVNAAVSVIGQQELDLVAHTHYQEALNRLPGVNVSRNNGQESLAAIRSPVLTGTGACGAFLVAENGIPLRSSGFCNVNEMFDAHTENAARIEVIRGPGSAFWGSNAMHGMVNVVLPEPGDVGELSFESGPRGSYRAKGAIGYDYGKLKQTLLFTGIREDGYRAPSGVDQQKVSWLYDYTTNGGLKLDGGFTLINLNQETAGYVEGAKAYEDDVLRKSNPNPEAYRDSSNGRVWTSISADVGDWDVVVTPYWREVNMNFIQHFLPGQPVEDFEHRSLGVQAAAYRLLSNGANLAIGFDAENTTGALLQYQDGPTPGSAFLQNTIPQGKHYDYDVDAQQWAIFMNYEQMLSDRLELSLGLRLDNINYDYDNKMIDGRTRESGVPCTFGGCRYNRPGDRSDDFSNLSPKLGMSYALNDRDKLQLRVQRGFRAPQATELYRLQNAQTVADLDYELALNGSGEGWDYSASVYYMDKENEIINDSSRANLNGAHTKHRGLELSVGYDLSDTLALRGVANLASHTYENSQISGGIDINGNDVDGAPNVFGNLRLTWRPSTSILTELEWVNMGDYYSNPENTASYDGHNLLNLRSQYRVNDDLSLSLNLLNITDVEYAERADWTSFGGDRYFPGEPARAFFSVNWSFR
jgi:iron complex outermembrane recepter protein